MAWHAVRALDEALSETRSILLPFDLGVWVRLAFISLFAGLSTPQTPTLNWNVSAADFDAVNVGTLDPTVSEFQLTAAILLLIAAVIVVGVLFAFIGSVMEFVLVRVLRSQSVQILRPFGANFGNGGRLFVFRLLVGITGFLAFALVVIPVAFAAITETALWLLLLIVTVPLLIVTAILAALVLEFTTAFVVPLMDEHGGGVFANWRRFWPTLRAEWQQFAVYVLVKLVLLVAVGFVTGLALAIVLVPLALLVGAAGLVGSLTISNVAAPVVVALVAAAIVALIALAAVSVPLVTYLRYHSLCTLDNSEVAFTLR